MRRKYPKAEKMKFLVCEQARAEINRKISILGLYPGDHIVFYPEVRGQFPYRLASLSFVIFFMDGVGEFDVSLELSDPTGNPVKKVSLDPVTLTEDGNAGVVVNMSPIQFNAEGDYIVTLNVGNKRYEFPFKVSSRDGPIPQ